MESHLMGLTVDFSMGFVCFDAASKVGVCCSFIISKNKKKRPSLCGEYGRLCVHSAVKSILNPQPPFPFFRATNLFCTGCTLGVWAHLFWRLFHPGSNISLLPAVHFGLTPKSESHAASSTAAQCVTEQGMSAAILFSKILALVPAVWTNNVTQGCSKRCQSIVYREKCFKHNPYVHCSCRQCTGWDYSVIKSCFWQISNPCSN